MINVIDNFFYENDFAILTASAHSKLYIPSYQPKQLFVHDRLKAYPCYETEILLNTDYLFKTFWETFENKTNLKIKKLKTFLRKILSIELENVFKYRLTPHQDDKEFDLAGVIYINNFNLLDGTNIYSNLYQIEPDIVVGAKPNRCLYYSSNMWHSPGHDKNTELRLIQPFFITLA